MLYQGTIQIEEIDVVARDTKKFLFSVKKLETLTGEKMKVRGWNFQAGQFLSILFDEKVSRAYSIASTPSERLIELIIRIIPNGKGSMILDAANVGDKFEFKGPFGHFTLSENPKAHLYFLGTGTGIAPLRSMILAEMESSSPRPMSIFYGGRNRSDIAYLDEIENWNPNLEIKLGLSREENPKELGKYGTHGRITEFIENKEFGPNDEFYICGNGGMVQGVTEILEKKGIGKDQIFMERFN